MATPQNALLDALPETGGLTEERFRRMSGASVGVARSPRGAPEGLPAGPGSNSAGVLQDARGDLRPGARVSGTQI